MIPQKPAAHQSFSYVLPRRLLCPFLVDVLFGRPRSFSADSREAMASLRPPMVVTGAEHIPARGPCLVTCNHYTRPGMGAWWLTLAISAAVAELRDPTADPEIRWIMTGAWTFPDSRWKRRFLRPVTRWGFRRVAATYGFLTMPPMPPDPNEVEARADAVRRALRAARHCARRGGMIGLAPEGRDTPERLGEPPPGVGRFIAHLTALGLPILPVGVGELGGRLTVAFGRAFVPSIPSARHLQDREVARAVMEAIRHLLP